MKFWHILVLVGVVTACLWAQNHVPFYSKITA